MDPATPLSAQNPFERIDNALKHIKQPIVETAAHARWAAKAQLQRLCTPLCPVTTVDRYPPSIPVPTLEPRIISVPWMGTPEWYDGNPELCRPFLIYCSYSIACNQTRLPPRKAGWLTWSATWLADFFMREQQCGGGWLPPEQHFRPDPSTKARSSFFELPAVMPPAICSPCAKKTGLR